MDSRELDMRFNTIEDKLDRILEIMEDVAEEEQEETIKINEKSTD